MKKINPAEFRHTIKIQRLVSNVDDDGLSRNEWFDVFTVKSKISNVKFEEILLGQGEGTKDIKTFYIRYRKGIKRTDKIIFNNESYNIKSLNDIENKGFYLAIKGEYIE